MAMQEWKSVLEQTIRLKNWSKDRTCQKADDSSSQNNKYVDQPSTPGTYRSSSVHFAYFTNSTSKIVGLDYSMKKATNTNDNLEAQPFISTTSDFKLKVLPCIADV